MRRRERFLASAARRTSANSLLRNIQLAVSAGLVMLAGEASLAQEASSVSPEVAARIRRIENGLQHRTQVTGRANPRYNIEERLKQLNIPGLSIAVVNDGKLEWAKGYGKADVAGDRNVDAQTMFLAGSISKPVSALRVHQLVEQGVLDLDTDVNQYLKRWKVPENEFTTTEKVTLRRILNHTAGLTVHGFPGYDKGDDIPSAVDVLDGEGNTPPVRVFREPGEAGKYSGGGYTIMQVLVADREDAAFAEILKTNVLSPLGMRDSTFENPLPQQFHARAATGYRAQGSEVEGKWPIYPEMAAAGLWTTPTELIQYAIAVQQIANGSQGILKQATVETMLAPAENGHGLGPVVDEHTFGHGGADEGFRAELKAWKETGNAVVIMVNSDNGSIIPEVLLAVAEEYKLPGVKPRMRTTVPLTDAQLQKFAGAYTCPHPAVGNIAMAPRDGGLEVTFENGHPKDLVIPESESAFFVPESNMTMEFKFKDEEVSGFLIRGTLIRGKKVK